MRRSITGFSNPLIKQARSLREKKGRRAEQRFLAEGLRIIAEARDSGALPEILFLAEGREPHPLAEEIAAEVLNTGGEVIDTSADILSKLSGKDNPQTLVGIYPDRATPLAAVDRDAASIWLVAQAMRDPGNLGTMLRTGDAVGAGGLFLIDDCADPFSVEAVRASMGAVFTQRVIPCRWDAFIGWLRRGEGELVGLSLQTELDYQQPAYRAPTFLLTGNESRGLPEGYETECDTLVKMPMLGRADSLNAAVATAVMAYEVLNQRRR